MLSLSLFEVKNSIISNWDIIPFKSFGPLKFGMDRKEIRKLANLSFQEFKKTKESKNTTDDFELFQVFYDENNKCIYIETSSIDLGYIPKSKPGVNISKDPNGFYIIGLYSKGYNIC